MIKIINNYEYHNITPDEGLLQIVNDNKNNIIIDKNGGVDVSNERKV